MFPVNLCQKLCAAAIDKCHATKINAQRLRSEIGNNRLPCLKALADPRPGDSAFELQGCCRLVLVCGDFQRNGQAPLFGDARHIARAVPERLVASAAFRNRMNQKEIVGIETDEISKKWGW